MRLGTEVGLIAIGTFTMAACSIHPGRVLLTRPHVYDSQTTRTAIVTSGKSLSLALRASGALKLDSVQQGSQALQTIAVSGRFGQVAGGMPPVPVPNGSASPVAAPTPVLPTAMAAPGAATASSGSGYGRTVEEQIEDLVHTEAVARGIELEYAALERTGRFGPNARAYLVEFDVNPVARRQSYWLYPFLLLRSGFASVYNFTQTWFTQVEFQLPVAPNGAEPLVRVYDVDPKHAVVTANDSLTNVSQAQLAALISSPTITGQADYFNRLEEAFGEQRRYPQQLGWHDGAGAFVWTFGPRRQIAQRHWMRILNPFLSKYRVVSRLEPGLRQGFALIVVPDVHQLRDAIVAEGAACPRASDDGTSLAYRTVYEIEARDEYRVYETYLDEGEARRKEERVKLVSTAYCEAARRTSFDKIVVPIVVTARHLMLDRPDQVVAATLQGAEPIGVAKDQATRLEASRSPLFSRSSATVSCTPGRDADHNGRRCPGILFMELPIAPSELAHRDTTVVLSKIEPSISGGTSDPMRMTATVTWNGDFVAAPPTSVELQYASTESEWRSLPAEILQVRKKELLVAALRPPQPKNDGRVRLRTYVHTDRWTYESRYPYDFTKLDGWRPEDKAAKGITIDPTSGMPGMRLTLNLPAASGRTVADVEKVQFGTIDLGPGAWTSSPDGSSLSLQVPAVPPVQPIQGAGSCHAVDVVAVFKTAPTTSATRFTYQSWCK